MQYIFTFSSTILLLLGGLSASKKISIWNVVNVGHQPSCERADTASSSETLCVTAYSVSSIVEFDWVKGNYDWIVPSKQRLLLSQFVFSEDGSFTYVLPYDNTTTYRLYGAWAFNDEGERIFQGSTGTNNGAGSSTSILVSGRTYVYGGQTRATLSYASGANYYAKVNNAEFANSASKRFNAKIVLAR